MEEGGAAPHPAARELVKSTIERVEERLDELGERLVASYLREIVDYTALDEATLRGDVRPTAVRNVRALLDAVRSGEPATEDSLEELRRSAVRRLHQGVSLQALLHAYRLWGQVVWAEVRRVAEPGQPATHDAALDIAGRVMAYVDQVSIAVAQAYLDEATGVRSDDEAMRRDLLEALLSGRQIDARMRRRAAAAHLDLDGHYAVALARVLEPGHTERAMLRDALAGAREHLHASGASVLAGIREDEVVIMYPLPEPADYRSAVRQATGWAQHSPGFAIGVGRRHQGVRGIAASYAEAEEAVRHGPPAAHHAVTFSDVLLDHLIRSSPHADALLDETIRPLQAYDRARNADLLGTLRTYYERRFSLARSAADLHVHPNTVEYRLRRIHQLTDRDPHDPDDLLLLLLGLKAASSLAAD